MPRSIRPTARPRRQPLDPAKKLLIKQALIGVGLFSLVALLLTAIWHVTRLEVLTIHTVQVAGGDTVSLERVEEIVTAVLDEHYFHLVPKRFSYFYPAAQLQAVVQDIPRVQTVVIDRPHRTRLAVTLTEYEPYALWCNEEKEECLFIDDSGYAFATAPELSGGTFVRFFSVRHAPEVGGRVLELSAMQAVDQLVTELPTVTDWVVTAVRVESAERIALQTQRDAELFITLNQPVAHTLHYLRSLVGTDEYSHLRTEPFQYIDLRFGNRLFINEQLVIAATTTATATDSVAGLTAPEAGLATTTPPAAPSPAPAVSEEDVLRQDSDVTQTMVVEERPESSATSTEELMGDEEMETEE